MKPAAVLSPNRQSSFLVNCPAARSSKSFMMEDPSPEETYLARLIETTRWDHPIQEVLSHRGTGNQRAICHFDTRELCSEGDAGWQLKKFLADTKSLNDGGKKFYIVENIGAEWMGILGVALGIDGRAFLEHAENHEGIPLWDAVMENERHRFGRELRMLKNNHIDGVLSNVMRFDEPPSGSRHITRRVEYDEKFGWQSTSRISYERVTEDTCQ